MASAAEHTRRRGDSGSAQTNPGRRREDVRSPAAVLGRSGGVLASFFAGFRLEPDGTLKRGEAVVHLPPKELAALRLLLAHAGQVVSPAQLRRALWGDVHVSADSVPKCLSSLRARLGPVPCIQTVYKRGYRFSVEVRRQSVEPAEAPQRLAILPFLAMQFVPKHLGSALAEEAIVRLTNAGSSALSVLARDSVFTLTGRGFTAQQIGEALKADLVLTGSIRALSSQFRLRAEMIRVEDGTQIWVEDLLVDQSQVAGLETELVRRICFRIGAGYLGGAACSSGWSLESSEDGGWQVEQANGELSIAAEAAVEPQTGPRRREAYEIFQRGHHAWQTLHRHQMQDGLQQLLRAIEVDPMLISAKIDLAHLCVTQAFYGYMSPAIAAGHVHRAADSIPGHPFQAEAILPALGWVHFHYDRNLPAALSAFAASAHLPHGPWTTRIRAMFALSRGRFAEAIELLRAAIQIDPYAPWLQCRLAWALHLDGQAAESLGQIQITLGLFPEHEFTNLYGALILAYHGEAERAMQIAQQLAERVPFFDLAIAIHAYALASAG
ncbi:MAG: winged helix-turn-helix domain-containing protein, partial [Terracidiphilus sp.]